MIKDARNKTVKSLTLASFTVTLNKFVFLGFDFITHNYFFFSFLFAFNLLSGNICFAMEY